jgi:hypothetical protein
MLDDVLDRELLTELMLIDALHDYAETLLSVRARLE